MRDTPSAITRAIADLPAALAAQPQACVEATEITSGAEQRADRPSPSSGRWNTMTNLLDMGRESAANEPAEGNDDDRAAFVHERVLVRNVVARRFVLARELNGLSQTEGAHAIGYAKSGQLSLIESGRKVPPLDVLVKASDAYSVSVDFLLGVSDHEERDPRMARRAAMRSFIETSIRGLADVLADTGEHLVEAQSVDVAPLAAAAGRVVEAFARVACRPEYEEVRNGATLAREIRELEAALLPAMMGLRRHAALDADLRQRIAAAKRGSS